MKKIILFLIFVLSISVVNAECLSINSNNTKDLINEIDSIDKQIKDCKPQLPGGISALIADGVTLIEIDGKNKTTIALETKEDILTSLSFGDATCKQKISVNEETIDDILSSKDQMKSLMKHINEENIKIKGCTTMSRIKFFFANPFIKFFAGRNS